MFSNDLPPYADPEIAMQPWPRIGDRVKAAEGTLAAYCGDISGVVEKIDAGAETIWVRMKNTKKLTPFRRDQLEGQARYERSN